MKEITIKFKLYEGDEVSLLQLMADAWDEAGGLDSIGLSAPFTATVKEIPLDYVDAVFPPPEVHYELGLDGRIVQVKK